MRTPRSVNRYDLKSKVAISSVLASASLAVFKLVIGLLTNSLGILSEALHSGLDVIAAIMTLYAVRISMRTPDLEHPYGYGKFESLSSLAEIILLFAVAAVILYEGAIRIFFEPAKLDVTGYAFLIIAVSIAVDFERSRVLYRVSRKYGSQALEADSLHFKADMLTSAVVLVGLAGVAFLNITNADAYAAIVASGAMVYTSLGLGRRTLDVLLDRAPKGILRQIEELTSGLDGVDKVTNVRVRKVGSQTFVDLHIEVPRIYTNERAHRVATLVEEKLRRVVPSSDILVHVDAVESDETVTDKIRLIAADTEGIRNVHSIYQSRLPPSEEGKIHAYLDVQMDGKLDFGRAHAIIDRFEKRVMEEIPEIGKVTTHEEVERDEEEAIGSEQVLDRAFFAKTRRLALSVPRVRQCRDVAVIDVKGEHHITLTIGIQVDEGKRLSLEDAHRIATEVENLLRTQTGASRVVAHMEPEASQGGREEG